MVSILEFNILGWPKGSFRVFYNIVWENSNILANPVFQSWNLLFLNRKVPEENLGD